MERAPAGRAHRGAVRPAMPGDDASLATQAKSMPRRARANLPFHGFGLRDDEGAPEAAGPSRLPPPAPLRHSRTHASLLQHSPMNLLQHSPMNLLQHGHVSLLQHLQQFNATFGVGRHATHHRPPQLHASIAAGVEGFERTSSPMKATLEASGVAAPAAPLYGGRMALDEWLGHFVVGPLAQHPGVLVERITISLRLEDAPATDGVGEDAAGASIRTRVEVHFVRRQRRPAKQVFAGLTPGAVRDAMNASGIGPQQGVPMAVDRSRLGADDRQKTDSELAERILGGTRLNGASPLARGGIDPRLDFLHPSPDRDWVRRRHLNSSSWATELWARATSSVQDWTRRPGWHRSCIAWLDAAARREPRTPTSSFNMREPRTPQSSFTNGQASSGKPWPWFVFDDTLGHGWAAAGESQMRAFAEATRRFWMAAGEPHRRALVEAMRRCCMVTGRPCVRACFPPANAPPPPGIRDPHTVKGRRLSSSGFETNF